MKRPICALFALVGGLWLAGCQTTAPEVLEYDAAHPLLRLSRNGILFRNRFVSPGEAVALLEKYDIPKDETLHILIDEDYTDRRAPWVFQHNYLARAGYRRTILVHARKAESAAVDARKKPPKPPPKRAFRYKRADEY
ncbi:MAG TPA: hypothetical protein DDY72_06340 [Verrucomicrobia bacterium]|nr:hypothetical protein [Verrucomicrobiota bacterium]